MRNDEAAVRADDDVLRPTRCLLHGASRPSTFHLPSPDETAGVQSGRSVTTDLTVFDRFAQTTLIPLDISISTGVFAPGQRSGSIRELLRRPVFSHLLVQVLDQPWFLARWTVRGAPPAGAVRLALAAGCRKLSRRRERSAGRPRCRFRPQPKLAGMTASSVVCTNTNRSPATVDTVIFLILRTFDLLGIGTVKTFLAAALGELRPFRRRASSVVFPLRCVGQASGEESQSSSIARTSK